MLGVQWSYRIRASHDDPFSYGYRGVESARQTIADARYKGPKLPYYPR